MKASQVQLHTLQGTMPNENVGPWPGVGKPVSPSYRSAVLTYNRQMTPMGLQPPCQNLFDTWIGKRQGKLLVSPWMCYRDASLGWEWPPPCHTPSRRVRMGRLRCNHGVLLTQILSWGGGLLLSWGAQPPAHALFSHWSSLIKLGFKDEIIKN